MKYLIVYLCIALPLFVLFWAYCASYQRED
jgi:hypothetical protein